MGVGRGEASCICPGCQGASRGIPRGRVRGLRSMGAMPRHHRGDPAAGCRPPREGAGSVRPRKGRLRCGFTLVELLVVVAIIALLAGILFPVFAQAREKGRQNYCLANLLQMGAAMMLYTEDHDGFYPPVIGRTGSRPVGFDSSWLNFLSPYLHTQ